MTSLRDELMDALQAEGTDIDLIDENDPLSPVNSEPTHLDDELIEQRLPSQASGGIFRQGFDPGVTSNLHFMEVSDSSREGSPLTLSTSNLATFNSQMNSAHGSVLEPGTSPSQDNVLMPSPDTMTDFRTHGLVIDTASLASPTNLNAGCGDDVQVLPDRFTVSGEDVPQPAYEQSSENVPLNPGMRIVVPRKMVSIADPETYRTLSIEVNLDEVSCDEQYENDTETSSYYDTFSSTSSATMLLRRELEFMRRNQENVEPKDESMEWSVENEAACSTLSDPDYIETVQSTGSGQALLSRTLQEVKKSLEDMSPTFVPSHHSSLGSVSREAGGRYIKNLIVMSFGFMFIMIAFLSLRSLQSSMNHEGGLGLFSLSMTYATFMVGCIFASTFVRVFRPKWTILVSLFGLIMFTGANYYPNYYTLIPTSAILGFSLATLWTAQGVYITSIAITYAAASGAKPEAVLNLFNGFFLTFCQLSQIIGNLISSSVFNMEVPEWLHVENKHRFENSSSLHAYNQKAAENAGDFSTGQKMFNHSMIVSDVGRLCGANYCHIYNIDHASVQIQHQVQILLISIFLGCIFLGLFILAVFMDRLDVIFHRSKMGSIQQLFVICRLHSNHKLLLLLTLNLFLGVEEAFMYGEVTKAFITCPLGIHMIGYLMICYGACDAIGSVTCGRMQKYVGRTVLISIGAVLTLSLLFVMLRWKPDPEKLPLFFLLTGGWGIADSIWQTQLCSLYGILFMKEHREAAFASLRMYEAIGCTIAFAYAQFLCMEVKIYITGGVLIFAMIGYGTLEILERRKSDPAPANV